MFGIVPSLTTSYTGSARTSTQHTYTVQYVGVEVVIRVNYPVYMGGGGGGVTCKLTQAGQRRNKTSDFFVSLDKIVN